MTLYEDLKWRGLIQDISDEKLIDKFRYVRKKIPNAYSYIYTNGSLLTLTKIDTIIKEHLLDELVVNNYSVKYKLRRDL